VEARRAGEVITQPVCGNEVSAAAIPALLRSAGMSRPTPLPADEPPPARLGDVAAAIQACRRCPIGCNGTRAVMGEGVRHAALMIVGEQPGDVEEREGHPFVGPAGALLRDRLSAAGIDEGRAYVTNAVKHFKFVMRGKRRLHQSPTSGEIDLCRWWLDSERRIVKPQLVLALGRSAARGVLGKSVAIARARGRPHPLPDGATLWVTAHPSYLLRLKDEGRETEERRFAEDLGKVARELDAALKRH
jgi:DNA polymerase